MKPVRLLAALLAVLAFLAACSPMSVPTPLDDPERLPSQAPVDVSGPVGVAPGLTYPIPFDVVLPGSRTVWPGTGDRLEDGGPLLLNLYAQDGRDGTVLQNTFADAPAAYTMSAESLGGALYEALEGNRVGARLLVLDEAEGVPVILVVDVLPTRASGTEVPVPEGLPTVTRDPQGAPTVTIPAGAPPPAELQVTRLVRGTGEQVEAGQIVTIEFTGVAWSTGAVFDSTWGEGSPPQSTMIGIGQVIEGWDQGLLEQAVGSQVMLVVPPSLGYADTSSPLAGETLVYVVDILDSHYPDAPEQQAAEPPAQEG
ncbi:FKBP-type peptidyl-prolyl cis-trans isomerase [Antribacter sp. KLBMP9083]|uniref:Peptidyl-prolyl cis-trans isomerase n=1 Tax=Antribacter soli TaxID=2910976 RepID=A0AA41UBM2_9MICO|nr:FKBP-type peptidyl-prolyl cis-trans isomerase [Antribacter soli]MCF4121244.1 FKBP-type peptidyl-prolyl cis-trans isomerase [Antribacter soli]